MFAQLGYYICVPFAFLTRLFYSWTGSYGVALILFTLVVKLVLLPFQLKSKKSMLRMNRMQGKIKDIQPRYANNQQRQQEAKAHRRNLRRASALASCLDGWGFLSASGFLASGFFSSAFFSSAFFSWPLEGAWAKTCSREEIWWVWVMTSKT